jgi:predicted DNA-binding transcriptional regulator AlpA
MPTSTASTKALSQAERLKERLSQFPLLPADAGVELPLVCALTGRSPSSVWRDVAAGRLPKPLKYGPRSTRWRVGDLRVALSELRGAA